MIAAGHPALVREVDGACWPAGPGSACDASYALACLALRDTALTLARNAQGVVEGSDSLYLRTLAGLIETMPGDVAVDAFRPAIAFAQPDSARRDPVPTALGLVRFLAGGPNTMAFEVVVPQLAFPSEGLFFPHLGIMVDPADGPVLVSANAAEVRFIWCDGSSATIPADGLRAEPNGGLARLKVVPRPAGWMLLNGCGEVHDPALGVAPALSIDGQAFAALEEGVSLLAEIWPVAASAARRFFNAVVVQPVQADHVTSITCDRLQGALIASCRDGVQVADAICHEGSHTRLALFLRLDPLIEDDGAETYVSPWRRDLRPLKGLLNGVHSFVNVCTFYRRLAERRPEMRDHAMELFQIQRRKVRQAWDVLASNARPTPLGALFLEELEQAVKTL